MPTFAYSARPAMGGDIIPVNPLAGRMLGKTARKTLEDVHEPVDMVLIFRPSSEVAPFIRAAAARPEAPVIWLQEGIRDDQAAAEYIKLTTYTSVNTDALKLVPAELADTLPTSPKLQGKVFIKSDAWWAENLEKTLLQFKQWQLA
jgi:hypothetical protein